MGKLYIRKEFLESQFLPVFLDLQVVWGALAHFLYFLLKDHHNLIVGKTVQKLSHLGGTKRFARKGG